MPSLAGMPAAILQTWQAAEPVSTDDFAGDCGRYTAYWKFSRELLSTLPSKPARNAEQASVAETVIERTRATRQRFLTQHVAAVYQALTQNYSRFLRVETLVQVAADAYPGLVPSAGEIAEDAGRLQRDKEGVEI